MLEKLEQNAQNCPRPARLLGIDQGEKTLGLALSNADQSLATPLHVIKRSNFKADRAELAKVITEYEIKGIIFGFPLNMDGSEGPRCQSVRDTITALQKHAPFDRLWISLWDERMSTSAMDKFLVSEADLSRKKRKNVIDKMAAHYILQGALDYLQMQR